MTGRRCTGTTVRGAPCKAAPLADSDRCAAHPVSPGSTRFGSPDQARAAGALGGRPPVPRATELQRQLVEQHARAVVRPYFRTLGLDIDEDGSVRQLERGAIVVGRDKEGGVHLSDVEDLGSQITAAEALLNRVYGKPRQALEHTGAGGGPIEIEELGAGLNLSKLSDEQLEQLQELLARAAR